MTALETRLVCAVDGTLEAPCHRWVSDVTAADLSVVERARGPALDVGCGPGRHVVALAERGISAMGIDVTPAAIQHARRRGAPVLERSVFERIPRAGQWASALVLDGNIGIGGDPVALLHRVAALVRADGVVLVELDAPGTARQSRTVRFDFGVDPGPWFALASVGVDTLDALARDAALRADEAWSVGGRFFASLSKARP